MFAEKAHVAVVQKAFARPAICAILRYFYRSIDEGLRLLDRFFSRLKPRR